jgi:hypothetical protein
MIGNMFYNLLEEVGRSRKDEKIT